MKKNPKLPQNGFTLIEMMVVILLISIPILAAGILAAGGSRSFRQTYNSIHKPIREDAMAVLAAFGSVGRKSNQSNYKIYRIENGLYLEAQPLPGEEIASGQAVEFRYWQQPFDPQNPGEDALQTTNTGTHYALFYLDGKELKVDYGTLRGGIGPVQGGTRTTANLTRKQTLARNVDLAAGTDLFSHNVVGGAGMGCVRLKMTLTDEEGQSVEVKTAVLLRMKWPR